ncbi:MAG TPA: hypothetical protein ENN58_02220 [bacterium]|nr:hypothetical protein [bacterium]
MKFLPAYYIFRNNIKKFKLPPDVMKELKKHSLDYYLKLPEIREILDNAWFVGVFRIHPDTGKLIYHAANYYKTYEEIETDEFAQQYRVPGIIKAGMTVTMTKAVVRGRELKKDDEKEEGTFREYNDGKRTGDDSVKTDSSGGSKSGG